MSRENIPAKQQNPKKKITSPNIKTSEKAFTHKDRFELLLDDAVKVPTKQKTNAGC